MQNKIMVDVSDCGLIDLTNFCVENPIFLGLEFQHGRAYGIIGYVENA